MMMKFDAAVDPWHDRCKLCKSEPIIITTQVVHIIVTPVITRSDVSESIESHEQDMETQSNQFTDETDGLENLCA